MAKGSSVRVAGRVLSRSRADSAGYDDEKKEVSATFITWRTVFVDGNIHIGSDEGINRAQEVASATGSWRSGMRAALFLFLFFFFLL